MRGPRPDTHARRRLPGAPFLAALLVLAGQGARAEIGKVTVDGEALDPAFFVAERRFGLPAEFRCPPHSDARVRDAVVDDWLVVQAAEERGYGLSGFTARVVERADGYPERLAPLVEGERWIDLAEAAPQLLRPLAAGFRSNGDFEVGPEDVRREYERLVREGDPLVVDVPLFRAVSRRLEVGDPEERARLDAIAERHAAGAPWAEIRPLFAGPRFSEEDVDEEATEWRTLDGLEGVGSNAVRSFVGDVGDVESGDLIGPLAPVNGRSKVIYVHEARVVDVLPLDARLNFFPGVVETRIGFRVKENRRSLDPGSLLSGRTVLEDGEPIVHGGPYPDCPR